MPNPWLKYFMIKEITASRLNEAGGVVLAFKYSSKANYYYPQILPLAVVVAAATMSCWNKFFFHLYFF